MGKKDVTMSMMLVCGRGRLVEGAIDVSCCNDDSDAAAVGEDVLTLLPDVSSPPSLASPPGCGDDVS